jgi:hypothetical protein
MEKDKQELLEWLDLQAQEQYGEFGFATCNEDEQVEIVYNLIMSMKSLWLK